MQDDLEVLKAELAEAKKTAEDMKKKVEDTKAETDASVASLLSQLAEAQEALAAEKTAKEKMLEEMNKMKKEKMMMKRKAELVEAGVAEAELEETCAKFESLTDEVFETVLAAIKKVATYPVEKKIEAPNTPVNVYVRKSVQASSEEVDENEADAEALETAEASEDIPMGETAEEESVRSFASEWFSKNVLKTTASIK